jgi:RNA polymerase sigma-70 factor (ECF subfamily)
MLDPVTPSRGPDSPVRRAAAAGTDHLPDLLLVERARAGEEQAVAALIRRYGGRLYRVARSVVPDGERAELIVQEAYLTAFGDLSRYEPTGKFAAWLTRLAYQQAHARRDAGVPAGALPPQLPQLPQAGEDTLERRELEHAISALPEVFRTVFVLRIVEGISGIETAACLGVHETTVRTRLYRAQRRLTAATVLRVRSLPALLELPAARLEQLLQRVLSHLPAAPR